jgi:hypothetical protein
MLVQELTVTVIERAILFQSFSQNTISQAEQNAIIHNTVFSVQFIAFCAPETTEHSISSNVSRVVAVQCTDLLAHVAHSTQAS